MMMFRLCCYLPCMVVASGNHKIARKGVRDITSHIAMGDRAKSRYPTYVLNATVVKIQEAFLQFSNKIILVTLEIKYKF